MTAESSEQPEPTAGRSRKKRWVLLILVLIVTATILGAKAVSNFTNAPSTGKTTVGAAKASQNGFQVNLTPTLFTGKTISFKYPRGLQSRAPSQLVGPDVEKAMFSAKDIMTWTLAIDVTNSGAQPLSNDSAYSFRRQHPEIYQEAHSTLGGQSVDIMTDKTAGGFSQVAFLQHDNLRATVSLIGDDTAGSSPLQTTFNMVLASWQWR